MRRRMSAPHCACERGPVSAPVPQLHVEAHEGDGPPALLVHGILSSRAQWMLNIEALQRVCTPVVVELWGHGRSPVPDDATAFEPSSYVELFDDIRERFGAHRWFVIGQSLGAALTLRYALDRPERVIAHVFTNSSSALAGNEWQRRMLATAPEVARRIEEGGAEAVAAMPIHPNKAKRLPDAVRTALLADAAAITPKAVAQALRYTVPASSVRDRVATNRVPTLLVAGHRERAFAEPRAFAAEHMPNLEVVDLDGGHAVNINAATEFNAAVTAFFARFSSSSNG